MRGVLFALAFIVATGPALASDRTDVMATVDQFFNGFNSGDMKAATAACASPASIIDEFPPHAWQGPTACADWAKAFAAAAKTAHYTDNRVTLGKPWRVDVTGDRAYVVIPATFTNKTNGKAVVESGAVFTAALQKLSAGWRITGWAWAGH